MGSVTEKLLKTMPWVFIALTALVALAKATGLVPWPWWCVAVPAALPFAILLIGPVLLIVFMVFSMPWFILDDILNGSDFEGID